MLLLLAVEVDAGSIVYKYRLISEALHQIDIGVHTLTRTEERGDGTRGEDGRERRRERRG